MERGARWLRVETIEGDLSTFEKEFKKGFMLYIVVVAQGATDLSSGGSERLESRRPAAIRRAGPLSLESPDVIRLPGPSRESEDVGRVPGYATHDTRSTG